MDFLKSFGKNSNLEDINKYYPAIYEESKLPLHSFYMLPNHTKIPYINTKLLINHINFILSGIEGIRGEYNEKKFEWELEWGTKPLEYCVENYQISRIIKTKKSNAFYASIRASSRFPHNIQHNNDNFELQDIKRWCKISIMLSYIKENNEIIIEYNKPRGDTVSFYYIVNKIRNNFTMEETKKWINTEAIWIKRKNYLMFIESIYHIHNNITNILCDEYCMREICSYL